ncbi:MAG TPA: hypothetical protein VGP63_30090 [Planctomycetaceae bacterium]|jgi:hypothetical protein|nr:hypothetical protein [Planctomycetaceae bacterium]
MRRAKIAFLFVAVVIGGGALLAPLLLSNSESMKGEERAAEAAREIHKGVEAARNEPKVDHAKRFGDWSEKDLRMGVKKEVLLKDIVDHVDKSAKPALWIIEDGWKEASVGRRAGCASLVWERFFRGKPGNTPLPIFDVGTKRQVATYSRDGGLVDSPSSK